MRNSFGLSKTKIDALGDRLRKGSIDEKDLRLLDNYRLSFDEAYESVVGKIRALAPIVDGKSLLEPTGRPAKSTTSIIAKLQRESIRLSQMQDIAGCRLTVGDLDLQGHIVAKIAGLFDKTLIVDRREQPSHGYRAVHVIVTYSAKPIEVQIRTSMQHFWAELSEKFSDLIDPGLKYGSGDASALRVLTFASDEIRSLELEERLANDLVSAQARSALDEKRWLSIDEKGRILETMERIRIRKERIKSLILNLADVTIERRGMKQ